MSMIDNLRDLNEELAGIVTEISNICDRVGDENARRYLIAPLEIIVEQGGWLSHDLTLPQWIDRLENRVNEIDPSDSSVGDFYDDDGYEEIDDDDDFFDVDEYEEYDVH